jgi:hypothetical protein
VAPEEDDIPLPGNGPLFRAGYALGGAPLLEVEFSNGDKQTINAGEGYLLSAGFMATPYWRGKVLGLGGGAEIGWKVKRISASNASVDLSRFPLILSAHLLARLDGRWYVFGALGAAKDLNVTVAALEGLSGTSGPYVAAGIYHSTGLAWDARLHAAFMDYTYGRQRVDAKTFGLTMALHLDMD